MSDKVRFRVTRTSAIAFEKPCPEAFAETFTEVIYTTLSLEDAMVSSRTEWFRRGTINHRPNPCGGALADKPGQVAWFVELDMEGLEAFCKAHGDIVIAWDDSGALLEIYDDYRE